MPQSDFFSMAARSALELSAALTPKPGTVAHLDFCGALSCDGGGTPEFPSLVCTLPVDHDGMHKQDGVPCAWMRPDELAVLSGRESRRP